MRNAFPNLFSPLKLGNYVLKNRIMNTGHAAHYQQGDGTPSDAYAWYVRERAKGGAGIIVAGHTVPVYDGQLSLSLTNYSDKQSAQFKKMADAAHEFDTPILAQLGHRGRRLMDSGAYHGRAIVAPSPVPTPDFSVPMVMPHRLTIPEIESIVDSFGSATRRLRECGYDGIELAVGMDYLIPNFLHSNGNRRDDKYGGATMLERMTFLREVLGAIRNEMGRECLVGIRMYDDLADFSLQLPEFVELAKILEKEKLVDYFNMWHAITSIPKQGRAHWPSYYFEPGAFVHLPAAIKAAVDLPVVGAGRMDSPGIAEQTLASGKADIIGMAKTLIADPHFPNKAKAGRVEDIRQCIGCTQACVGHVDIGLGVGCIYNPVTGREEVWGEMESAAVPKKVVIIGGGPAGMEAARVAAERGHKVTLIDRGTRLGGQVNLVMKTPKRDSFEEIILWFERQLPKLGVEIRLKTEATVDSVLAENADEIIVATGSTAYMLELDGVDGPNVFTARAVMEGKAKLGNRVVLFDAVGRGEGATVADYIADQGHQVNIVTGLEKLAPDMPSPTRHHLLEKLMGNPAVTITPYTAIFEITEREVEAYNVVTWEPTTIEDVDSVVISAGGIADETLIEPLRNAHPSVRVIGDCFQPRDIELSITDGHKVGREI
ncbi:FAD-dependent oxidoreductase [Shinella zoogloeoides]|uniref:oxidoreductase n=1 Tax=Shinella zoogloeoides TaxID=352475 RepID=UPI00299EB2D6|nr:FAD-dependent oxidoreductase [Shinella zoogloeoides]WPE24335.1 NADH oxidase [Shinella zoogloeoides]